MSTLRLMLVRHGQSEANVRGELDTRPPGAPLSAEGHLQAAALADRLSTMPVTGVYASIAMRAQQTARPVADVHALDLAVIEGVHEVQAGDLEGRADAVAVGEFAQVFHRWLSGEMTVRMPGGPTGAEVCADYLGAVQRIRDRHPDGLVVLVSHSAAIRLAAQSLVPDLNERLADQGLIANTGHVLLEVNGDGWRCLEWSGLTL